MDPQASHRTDTLGTEVLPLHVVSLTAGYEIGKGARVQGDVAVHVSRLPNLGLAC